MMVNMKIRKVIRNFGLLTTVGLIKLESRYDNKEYIEANNQAFGYQENIGPLMYSRKTTR